ncbi:MAG: hypothetical protein ACYTEX_26660 [Planctomycetota bacterium]|jgi:hypothetical protein
MSRDLPLWEDDESDVRAEHKLQSGHALISTDDIDRALKKIGPAFSLPKPTRTSHDIRAEWIPEEKGFVVLNDDKNWHFILVRAKDCTAVFAPHFLFFNSRNWIKLGRRLRAQVTVVDQLDIGSFAYTVFRQGKHICNACRDGTGIHETKMGPIECYLDGKLIYQADDATERFTPDIVEFLARDVIICVDQRGQIRFKVPLSKDEYIEPLAVRHAVFPGEQSRMRLFLSGSAPIQKRASPNDNPGRV